jgi:hypothetical protein
VVFTGGTIGSAVADGRTGLDSSPPRQLLSYAPAELDLAFTESEPFRILSEDATLEHWTLLARHIAGLDFNGLDAVVVAHGSDTLAWTAKALVYALAGCPKPVVLVAADLPLTDKTSNGPQNFRDAISFALGENLPGIFAAWRNPDEDTAIHLGSRLLPCDIHDDKFRSAKGLIFGHVRDGEFRRRPVEGNPSRSHLVKAAVPSEWIDSRRRALEGCVFEPRLLVLPAQPSGWHPKIDDLDCPAVLQLAYHSGTACSDPETGSFGDFAQRCRILGISVVVGPSRHGTRPYQSVDRLRGDGVVFAPSMAESALVVKLRWLLARGLSLDRSTDPIGFDLLP